MLFLKGGVYGASETMEAFFGPEGRYVEALEGWTVLACDWPRTGQGTHVIHFLLARHGGIAPPVRRRSQRALTLAEREDISRESLAADRFGGSPNV